MIIYLERGAKICIWSSWCNCHRVTFASL